jgi:hypothetical protein
MLHLHPLFLYIEASLATRRPEELSGSARAILLFLQPKEVSYRLWPVLNVRFLLVKE